MMACGKLSLTLLLCIPASGCRWSERRARHRDRTYLGLVEESNRQQHRQTVQSTVVPEPPIQLPSATTATPVSDLTTDAKDADRNAASTIASNAERELALNEAIETILTQSQIARVTVGGNVTTAGSTFYDVEASEARLRAALAAFDTRFESQFYTNQFNNPPNAFFGPGLTKPLSRDEAALTAGFSKPLKHGGLVTAAYNPSPGYFFVPGSTSTGFNPSY